MHEKGKIKIGREKKIKIKKTFIARHPWVLKL